MKAVEKTIAAKKMGAPDVPMGHSDGRDPRLVNGNVFVTECNEGMKREARRLSRVLSRIVRCGAVIPLGPPLPTGSSGQPGSGASHAIAPLFGLAPDGVYRAASVTGDAVGSYPQGSPPRRVSPATVSPLPEPSRAIGGLFSVALSVASRRPAVSRHPAL